MTTGNGPKMNVKMLLEAEDTKKRMGGHKYYWRNGVERQINP